MKNCKSNRSALVIHSRLLAAASFLAVFVLSGLLWSAPLTTESAAPPFPPTPPRNSKAARSALRGPARFWDAPPRSAATVFLDDESIVIPGPDDPVRVIVQLRSEPIGARLKQTLGARQRLTSAEGAALRQYADTLIAQRRQFLAQAQQQNITLKTSREFGYLVNGAALSIRMRDWRRLERLPQVKAVYPDYKVHVLLNESVSLIGAPTVWAMKDPQGRAVTGQGVRVAIIDSGVDYTHPDLGGCLGIACRVIGGYDFVDQDNDPMDELGHCTHVAGIVAAKGALTGVAPDARLLAYRVLDATGTGKESDIIAALERAANPDADPLTDDGAQVINLSLGGDGNPNDPLSQAVDQAVDLGIVVVAAAGNYGTYGFESLTAPGVARHAITVAASDKYDQLAAFSSRGPVRGYEDNLKPDITAPGVDIRSTTSLSGTLGSPDRYRAMSGTSMAAPHISGAAALLRQAHPTWTPGLIKANLMNTAKDLGKSVYEQGAGRVRVAQAAAASSVSTPGSWSFGIPSLAGATFHLSLANVSSAPLTVTARITTVLWANEALAPLSTPVPVSYAQLSGTNLTIAPNATSAVTVTLALPGDVAEGYYTGQVLFQGTNYTLSVPFAFTMLSKVTVRILGEDGAEVIKPEDESRQYAVTFLVRTPNLDVRRNSGLDNQTPAIFYIPAGTYNLHGYARFWIYDSILNDVKGASKPLILSTSITVGRNQTREVFLRGAAARRFTLNARDFDGAPFYLARWRALSHYQNGAAEYSTGMDIGYLGYKDSDLRAGLPSYFDFYIGDTLPRMDFTFASDGYGYSARQSRFQSLNSTQWYEDVRAGAGFDLIENADQAFWFAWQYPRIDAATPRTFQYSRDQISRYRTRYDIYGILDRTWYPWDSNLASGGEVLFYLPFNNPALLTPLSAGLERDLYVKGAFAYRYLFYRAYGDRFFEKELYTHDWTRAFTTTEAADVWTVSGRDLQALPPRDEISPLGVGPLYPAITFDNDAATIRFLHPILGSGLGNKSVWGNLPQLAVYRSGATVYTDTLKEWWWSPSPMRQMASQGNGAYRVVITETANALVGYENVIEAGFTLPATDSNPPRLTGLEMPQRFSAGQSIPVTMTVSDAESGMGRVEVRYSGDAGATWVPLTVAQAGNRYMTTINPSQAMTVSLGLSVWDNAGNYLAFVTKGAAMRQVPVAFNLNVSPMVIHLVSSPYTLRLTGSLNKSDGQILSQAAVPVRIYLNDQLAGYVRNIARLPDGAWCPGEIFFDWTFIPTDFVSRTGNAQLKFVFDLGAYAREERVFSIAVTPPEYRRYLPFIPNLSLQDAARFPSPVR